MAQYVFTMNRVSKTVPPKRQILKDISLSFFPGAKIGMLGINGSGKSSLLKIMAGVDKEYEGEATPMPGIKIGYLPQEPQLDPTKDVQGNVNDAVATGSLASAKAQQVMQVEQALRPLLTAQALAEGDPYKGLSPSPLVPDEDWVALQGICDG